MSHQSTCDGESLSTRDFTRIAELIRAQAGIRLGSEKKTMVEVRLKRRLQSLSLVSYRDYCEFLFRGGIQDELVHLINVLTTNKTDFFRESAHFELLTGHALPELCSNAGATRPLLVWSAGCSSGEEPYTLAMVLSDYAAENPEFRFRILATDISTAMLDKALRGIYSEEAVQPVAHPLRRKYLLRSRDPQSCRVRIAPELRRLVEFRRLNFMDQDYGLSERADAIFCRNVLIYFDRATQQEILRKLIANLAPGGYLFVGHSETLHEMVLPVIPVAPALYRKLDARL